MPRSEARIYAAIWEDEDFLALAGSAQRLYMFLLSQKDLAHCGVIPLRVSRWVRKAKGLTAAQVEDDLEMLAAGRRPFVILDEDTGELFVRSLIRHDGVWKVPNIMKSARESAVQIESQMIRAALLAELLRIPAQESESVHVRRVHADFVADLRKGSGNPSPDPSGNGSGNPEAIPSPYPSQGKGEGYGPVVEDSPFPNSPSPSPRGDGEPPHSAHLSAVPDVKAEEGESFQDIPPDIGALVAEVRAIRADWSTRSIRRALDDPSVRERPWPVVRRAMLAVAADPASKQPGRLSHDGPWWHQPAAEEAGPDALPWCGQCAPNRRLEDAEGRDDGPCPDCHPSKVRAS